MIPNKSWSNSFKVKNICVNTMNSEVILALVWTWLWGLESIGHDSLSCLAFAHGKSWLLAKTSIDSPDHPPRPHTMIWLLAKNKYDSLDHPPRPHSMIWLLAKNNNYSPDHPPRPHSRVWLLANHKPRVCCIFPLPLLFYKKMIFVETCKWVG